MKILRFAILLLFSVIQFLHAAERVSYKGLVYTVNEWNKTAGVEWLRYSRYGDRINGYYWKYNVDGYSGNITIPEKMEYMGEEYTVIELREHCFENCKIDTITIPKTIKNICSSAFKEAYVKCVNIQDVSSWCGIEINSHPANYIASKIDLPSYASMTLQLTSLYINGEPALDLVIPSDVNSIKASAFYGFGNIKTVTISDSTKEIGSAAFQDCKSLISVVLPQNISKIAKGTFSYCDSLSQIQLPNGIITIEETAFNGSRKLQTVIIPNSVVSIGVSAFESCPIDSLIIGTNVREIGEHAFNGVGDQTKIYSLPTVPPTICHSTFNYQNVSLTNHHNACLYVPSGCKQLYIEASGWKLFNQKNIFEIESDTTNQTGIKSGIKNTDSNVTMRYSINGNEYFTPRNGINIIRMKDGTTKKVVVK